MLPIPGARRPVLLELDLTEAPTVTDGDDPLSRVRARGRRQLRPMLRALHEAGGDSRVVGLIAKLGGPLSWALAQELRLGVQAFAASGKPTVAWAESFGDEAARMAPYVLASAFGQIWLQQSGGLGLLGVGSETTFLGGALDRLGIVPQLEQRHEYKSAVDRLTRTEFTPAHREAVDRLSTSIFDDAVEAVAVARRMDVAQVRALVDRGPLTATEARDAGLIDRIGYRDEVYAALRDRVADGAELLYADRWQPRPRLTLPRRRRGHVALVEVRGSISTGRTRRGPRGRQVGSDTVSAQLQAALEDRRAQAVVLRVESPGGSVVASDTIWREVCRVREAGLPLVVSMGRVAGSGGYYISCPADVIVALPATLTGSIGVFGGKFVVRDLLGRLGVTTGAIEHGARSLMFSARREFTDDERERLARIIDGIYDDFVAKVAQGRGRPIEEIEPVARGRVWTGRDAIGIGLVDELGGLRDAVRIARTRAGLPEDAPVLPALRVPAIARFGKPTNSEDPRALVTASWPGLSEFASALGLTGGTELLMPPIGPL